MKVFTSQSRLRSIRHPLSWFLVFFAFSCGGIGEDDVKASAPLLSKEKNINVISQEEEAPLKKVDPRKSDEVVQADAQDADPTKSPDISEDISGGETGGEDSAKGEPEAPARNSTVSQEEESVDTWLSATGNKRVMSEKEVRTMNKGWSGNEAKGKVDKPEEVTDTPEEPPKSPLEMTPNQLVKEAFKSGGKGCTTGDCREVIEETLKAFNIEKPIDEEGKLTTGNYQLDLSDVADEEERIRLLDAVAQSGPVLIRTKDAYGFYLGRSKPGAGPRALMARPQENAPDGELKREWGVVSMESGMAPADSPLQQLEEAVLFVPQAGGELSGVVQSRPVVPLGERVKKGCKRSKGTSVYVTPAHPKRKAPLRFITLVEKPIGPHEVKVIGPKGESVPFELRQLQGPPRSMVVTVEKPKPGNYQLLVGEGKRLVACKDVRVARYGKSKLRKSEEAVWTPRRRWNKETEGLYAAFIESLFDYPLEEDRTWTKMQELIADPNRNFLYNYYGQKEDDDLELEPDCADLPYFLRAYFAWKMKLPFAYHRCSGGLKGRPPVCQEEIFTPHYEHKKNNPIKAFKAFMRQVASGVHSGNARTSPGDSLTDLYPVDLTKEVLRPGTVFADPYGHLLVIAKWVPQPKGGYGVLMAGDAQPDGTVGRRRFWKGSFLFIPETADVGSGFKAFRPVTYDKSTKEYAFKDNDGLKSKRNVYPWSGTQYKGSMDDFYDAMEGLINPRPLDPSALQRVLVDSFEESVARRLNSVNNGEAYMKEEAYAVVEMPERSGIFQTIGPWEDFSTPSRDMRLLISMDTVVQFPDKVARNPERYGAQTSEETDALVGRLRAELNEELSRRTFEYVRSNGQSQTLSLKDVTSRAQGFEMGYNPNDCVERRWAAPEGSDEYKSCQRFAPEDQRGKMTEYRSWFETRMRPPRGS